MPSAWCHHRRLCQNWLVQFCNSQPTRTAFRRPRVPACKLILRSTSMSENCFYLTSLWVGRCSKVFFAICEENLQYPPSIVRPAQEELFQPVGSEKSSEWAIFYCRTVSKDKLPSTCKAVPPSMLRSLTRCSRHHYQI